MSVPRRPKNAGKRPDTEQWLTDNGVEFEYVANVPLEDFDFDESARNQARFQALNPATVEEYATAMQRGDVFPAVVAYRRTARGKLTLVDGNHRLNGAKRAGADGIDTYILGKARGQVLGKLSYQANTRHGLPTSFDERVHQAIWLVDNGMSRADAAATVNIKESELTKAWNRVSADRRADEVGVSRKEWDGITQAAKTRLASVITDEGFRAAANLVARASLDATEVFELVADVNKVRSSSRQVGIVKQWESTFSERIQEAAASGGIVNRRQRTPKQVLGMALTNLSTLPEDLNLIADRYMGDERTEMAKRAREAAARLESLAARLDSASVPG